MKKILASIFILIAILSACSDNSTDPQSGNGSIKMYMVDSPSTYDSVIVCVTSVEIHRSGDDTTSGWFVINDSTRYFDLLKLRNGASAILGDTSLPAGQYTQIRLILGTNNYVIENGVKHSLVVPSGSQTGLKLNHQFTIETGVLYELMLDFNVDKSIIVTGNGAYKLKPVIRVIPVVVSGSISGRVLPLDALATVFTTLGSDTVTTYPDIDGYFKLMALPQGNYNVEIEAANVLYRDTVITNINVIAIQNTELGEIILGNQ